MGQLRSDVLRYEILHRFGGVYVDADLQALRSIEPLLGVACFAAWEEPSRWIGNTVLGAVAGHPFLDRVIEGLEANVEAKRGERPNKLTGPQYLTRVWLHHGTAITLYPREFFYPFSYGEVERYRPGEFDPAARWPDAYAVHWWANRRRRC